MCEQNKKQYIEREEAKETVKYIPYCDWKTVGDWLDEIPAADVVEVCRCQNCKWYQKTSGRCYRNVWNDLSDRPPMVLETDFCSYGERRSE